MKHLSLFNGIGGFQLAAHWVGWNNVAHVEIDDWCNKVVAQHFPNSKCFTDIKDFNGKEYEGAIDIISGGFPCQPFSTAGKRKGEEDDRNLWPEYLRIIQEVKPAYVVGENVAGLLSMENGKTLEGIFTDLESEGYTVEPFIIPAAGVGAWHRRDRVWIVGYTEHHGQSSPERRRDDQESSEQTGQDPVRESKGADSLRPGVVAHTDSDHRSADQGEPVKGTNRGDESGRACENVSDSESSESQVPMRSRRWRDGLTNDSTATGETKTSADNKGIGIQECGSDREQESQTSIREKLLGCDSTRDGASYWSSEPGVGRMVARVSHRVDRIKGLGNAIVPQVAFEIFKIINQHYENS